MLNHDPHLCLICYSNYRKRSNTRGHYGHRPRRKPYVPRSWETVVKKPDSSVPNGTELTTPIVGAIFASHSAIWEMMTCDKWDDGTPRERATLLVLCDGGILKLWLNDRALSRAAWISGDSLEAAMEALDHGIAEDSLPWRPQASTKRKK